MKFILYYHMDAVALGQNLNNLLKKKFGRFDHQIFQTLNGLKERFREVHDYNEKELFILLADSQSHLKELTTLIDLIDDKCLILILPDESRSTLSTAYGLFPRFCTKISDNYYDLCRVLNKMIANQQ